MMSNSSIYSLNDNGTVRDSSQCDDKFVLKIWNENLKNVIKWGYPININKIDPILYYVDKLTSFYALIVNFPKEIKRQLKLKYDFRIYYSKQIEHVYGDAKLLAIKNFLMHEIMHAAPDCFNHGKTWKKFIYDLNEKHGFRINPKPYSSKSHPETF